MDGSSIQENRQDHSPDHTRDLPAEGYGPLAWLLRTRRDRDGVTDGRLLEEIAALLDRQFASQAQQIAITNQTIGELRHEVQSRVAFQTGFTRGADLRMGALEKGAKSCAEALNLRIDNLERRHDEHQARMNTLEARIGVLDGGNAALAADLQRKNDRITNIAATVGEIYSKIDGLQHEYDDTEKDVQAITDRLIKLENGLKDLHIDRRLGALEQQPSAGFTSDVLAAMSERIGKLEDILPKNIENVHQRITDLEARAGTAEENHESYEDLARSLNSLEKRFILALEGVTNWQQMAHHRFKSIETKTDNDFTHFEARMDALCKSMDHLMDLWENDDAWEEREPSGDFAEEKATPDPSAEKTVDSGKWTGLHTFTHGPERDVPEARTREDKAARLDELERLNRWFNDSTPPYRIDGYIRMRRDHIEEGK